MFPLLFSKRAELVTAEGADGAKALADANVRATIAAEIFMVYVVLK